MSIESAKAFFEVVKSDEDLAKKLHEAKSEDGVRQLIASVGDYEFSQDEWKQAVLSENGVEVSDEDLEKVAGGGGYLSVNINSGAPSIFASAAGLET